MSSLLPLLLAASETLPAAAAAAEEPAGAFASIAAITVGVLFCLAAAICLLLALLGLPGVWILIAIAVAIDLLDGWWLSPEQRPTFSLAAIVASVLLAGVGELVEFLASAAGAKRGGASRGGILGSLVGAFGGSIAGTLLIPVPLLGTLAGAVVGAFLGAVLGELAGGSTARGSIRPATGAAVGRVLGTLGKLPFAIAVAAILAVAAFI